jgi:hypothetical protein
MTKRFIVLVLLLSNVRGLAFAQASAEIAISNSAPLIGEVFQVTLQIVVPVGAQVNWPSFVGDWGTIEVTSVSAVREENLTAISRHHLVLEMVAWAVGEITMPRWNITYSIAGDATPYPVSLPQLTLTVPSILTEDIGAGELRPLKPLLELNYFPYRIVLSLSVGLLTAMSLLVYKRYQSQKSRKILTPVLSSSLITRLELLEPGETNTVSNYAVIGDSLRQYIGIRFSVNLADFTTADLLRYAAQQTDVDVGRLRKLLEYVDLVRFAGVIPTSATTMSVIASAKRWILETEQQHAT